jgi:Trk K+ transport system NAD-binding subunit
MAVSTVREGSSLVDVPLGALDVAVAAIRGPNGPIEAIPSRSRTLAVGDTIYAVAHPAKLNRLGTAATGAGSPPLSADLPSDD